MVDAAFLLRRAAFWAESYDRDAKGEVRFNLTAKFHLCGLIERAATFPRSGSAYRRYISGPALADAKAVFCLARGVVHPSVWEWERRRSPAEIREALLAASETKA